MWDDSSPTPGASRPPSCRELGGQVGLEVVTVEPCVLAQRLATGEASVARFLLGADGEMIPQLAAAAHELDVAGARPPEALVALEGAAHRVGGTASEAAGEHRGVLERLCGALCEERQHRMRRIAEQRDPAAPPLRERIAVVHRPALG